MDVWMFVGAHVTPIKLRGRAHAKPQHRFGGCIDSQPFQKWCLFPFFFFGT